MAAAFTRVLPYPTLYDLTDVLESLSILLHAVVAQSDVVGEVWDRRGRDEKEERETDKDIKRGIRVIFTIIQVDLCSM